MGFFDKLKKQAEPAAAAFPVILGTPASGTFVPMAKIPDEVFSTGVLGTCCGIDPAEGKVFAPMNGEGFSGKAKVGQTVKKGDLLLTMDLENIQAAGHPATAIVTLMKLCGFLYGFSKKLPTQNFKK